MSHQDAREAGAAAQSRIMFDTVQTWPRPYDSVGEKSMGNSVTEALPAGEGRVGASIIGGALLAELERARMTLDSIADGVICTDNRGKVTYLNAVAEAITGWSRDEASGRAFSEVFRIVDANTREPALDPLERAVRDEATVLLARNAVVIRRDGSELAIEDSTAPIRDSGGRVAGAVMVFRDVSRARVTERELSRLAQYDPLTDLPNRALLNDRLSQALARARRHQRLVAVLFLDLDRFKRVNDSFGHAFGDRLLRETGKRLTAAVRGSDTVSRYGGDEFVIVLSELEHAADAALQAEKMHARLSTPYCIGQRELRTDVSIGISIFPHDGQDAETLIECADFAMYRAKSNRRRYQFFAG
jgi:diguanylate cyclase (GGDEF)-like protein/PAS domain S-box-containing protein